MPRTPIGLTQRKVPSPRSHRETNHPRPKPDLLAYLRESLTHPYPDDLEKLLKQAAASAKFRQDLNLCCEALTAEDHPLLGLAAFRRKLTVRAPRYSSRPSSGRPPRRRRREDALSDLHDEEIAQHIAAHRTGDFPPAEETAPFPPQEDDPEGYSHFLQLKVGSESDKQHFHPPTQDPTLTLPTSHDLWVIDQGFMQAIFRLQNALSTPAETYYLSYRLTFHNTSLEVTFYQDHNNRTGTNHRPLVTITFCFATCTLTGVEAAPRLPAVFRSLVPTLCSEVLDILWAYHFSPKGYHRPTD